jgi:hypothetical protein
MFAQSEENFMEDQVVWGKVKGHVWWPSSIHSVDNEEKTLFTVKFIGENTHSQLSINQIRNYEKYMKQFITKCKTSKFKNSVKIADKILSGEINFEEQKNYMNPKIDNKAFHEHFNKIKKDVVEKLTSNCSEKEVQDHHHQDSAELQKVSKKEDQTISNASSQEKSEKAFGCNRKDSDIIRVEPKLLNQKRKRVEETTSQSSNIEDVDGKSTKEKSDKEINSKKKRKHLQLNKIKTETLNKNTKSNLECDLSRNCKPRSPPHINSNKSLNNFYNLDIDRNKSQEIRMDSELILESKNGVQNSNTIEDSKEKIKFYLDSFKLKSVSFTNNVAQIESTIKSLDEFLEKLNKTLNIDSKFIVETSSNLKDIYQVLIDNSRKTLKILKSSIENTKNFHLIQKIKENSSLLEEIEKLEAILSKELADDEKKFENKKQLHEGNKSMQKYYNLFTFMKDVLSQEFKLDLSKEFATLEGFSMSVINGSYLTDTIQKFRKFHSSKEKEKTRTKIKIELENILSKSVRL